MPSALTLKPNQGDTLLYSDISADGQEHYDPLHLRLHVPQPPFDVALRCEAVSNVPQIQFGEDGVWHDFAPGRAALKAGPWFPCLQLGKADVRLTDLCVDRSKLTERAENINKAPVGSIKHHGSIMHHVRAEKAAVAAAAADCAGSIRGA